MNRRAALVLAALFSIAIVVIIGCGGGGSSSTNPGGGGSGPSFNFTFPATGASHSFTFTQNGSWDYHCTPHASQGMTGTVVVSASSMVDSVVVSVGPGSTRVFDPATVTIKTGGTVRWVNVNSSMTNHTVTRP